MHEPVPARQPLQFVSALASVLLMTVAGTTGAITVLLLPAEPGLVAVTVTTLVFDVALTPTELPFVPRLIAAARLVASCVVVTGALPDQYGKFVPVLSPLVPAVNVPQEKPVIEVVPLVNPVDPGV